MNFLQKLLSGFNYNSLAEFGQSLMPTLKYRLTLASLMSGVAFSFVDRAFGLDLLAFILLLVVFVTELITGIIAAHIKGEAISSMKLSRFTVKMCCYLVLISVTYTMSQSFKNHDKTAAYYLFEYMHIFFVLVIVQENLVSILENLAVIDGKEKTHWIAKIQEKIGGFLK